jgi:hypothetical protein
MSFAKAFIKRIKRWESSGLSYFNDQVCDYVKREVVVSRFPITYESLQSGSPDAVFYHSAMKSLLSCLALTGFPCVFKLVIEHTMNSREYVFQHDLEESVKIQARGPSGLSLIKLGFQFLKEKSMPRAFNSCHQLLLPLLRECKIAVLLQASCEEIRWLVSAIKENTGRRESERKQGWMKKSCCFAGLSVSSNSSVGNYLFSTKLG